MSKVVYLSAMTDPSVTPCLALVDLQREYTAGSRLMAIPDIQAALSNCKRACDHARTMGFPIAYLRQFSRSSFFNPTTIFSTWIEGFGPTGADMVFDREKPSCYTNKHFAELMESCGGNFVIAGFSGETACLSTAIDAFHRSHRFKILSDATASHALGHRSPPEVHDSILEVIRLYGEVMDTQSWITSTSSTQVMEGATYGSQ